MSVVLKTLEAFPRGRTTRELFSLLDIDFSSIKREAIRAELLSLQQRGIVTLGRDEKWRASARDYKRKESPAKQGQLPGAQKEDQLVAVPGRFLKEVVAVPVRTEADVEGGSPDPNALLRYYRAALRSDPRGALTQSEDRHGSVFQLVSGSGDIFPGDDEEGIIRIELDNLPDAFREAVFRREANENGLAVGWPIAVGRKSGAPAIRPVGLIAATWQRTENWLEIHISANDVLINPDWIKDAARNSPWSERQLAETFAGQGGTGLSRDEFRSRLTEAAAKSVRGKLTGLSFVSSLDPGDEGIFEAMGLFLPTGSTFTAGAVRDLDAIAAWEPEKTARTSLGPLIGLAHNGVIEPTDPINTGPLNHEQILTVSNAMSVPISVVTGPPGTGKSQAIVAMAATAILRGMTVVVASKNHQALDAVQERLLGISPKTPFIIRTLDPQKDVDQGVIDVINDLVKEPAGGRAEEDSKLVRQLGDTARRRSKTLKTIAEVRAINTRLADTLERLNLRQDTVPSHSKASIPERRMNFFIRLLRYLRLASQIQEPDGKEPRIGASRRELERWIAEDRKKLEALSQVDDPVELTEEIQGLAKSVLKQHLKNRTVMTEGQRLSLSDAHDDLVLSGQMNISREIAELALDHRPLWLASVLGTPRRVPLFEGLFDLVIFDEASQCDIASALPLLARAKRAVIVGDDRQLAFISQVGVAQDRNLMAAQGLPETGLGRFAQGRKSLFDLARSSPGIPAVMLRDQYRSASEIVEYINEDFYGNKLRVSADQTAFKLPAGTKAGLRWTHVPAQFAELRSTLNVNQAEIDAIVEQVDLLLNKQGFSGSVGVISPFRPQVEALSRALRARVSDDKWEKADLRVATVDGFQGQERDLILFSPMVHARSTASSVSFLQRDWRRLNVAISRARAVAHVFGDLSYARSGAIKRLQSLAARATEPRAKPSESIFDSEWERVVFHALRERGLDPKPQYEIAGRRLDFALFGENEVKLDLEVDGRRWHQDIDGNRKLDDHWRDHQMKSLGWKVRRFWVDELKQNMERCLGLIERDLK